MRSHTHASTLIHLELLMAWGRAQGRGFVSPAKQSPMLPSLDVSIIGMISKTGKAGRRLTHAKGNLWKVGVPSNG